jgi:hypothetical protein
MRTIPYELRQKLLKDIQTKSTDAEPQLRVVATQSTTNTLLSEIIHKDIPASYGDVAIRQLAGEKEPSLAYAVCLDNGTATVYERQFPSYLDKPWNFIWTLGGASEVAIEFNGTWQINATKQWYYLQTELTPYLFFVQGGTLYVQKWQDASTRVPLATGVSEISACRGWQSSDEPLLDQGLIVGYLKGGNVYYRALCLQESGELLWETERQVSELGSGNTSLCVFRTNDFRVGFICENGGTFKYVLSSRTYAGQSVRSESVYSQVVQDCRLSVKPIEYRSAFDDKSAYATGFPPLADCYIGNCMIFPSFSVVSTQRQNGNQFYITVNCLLLKRRELESYFTVTPDVVETTRPQVSAVTVSGSTICITTDVPISSRQKVVFALGSYSRLCFLSPQASPLEVPNFTAVFEPDYVTDDQPEMTVSYLVTQLVNTAIDYPETTQEEKLSLTITYTCSLSATQVGDVPV